ncbi:GTPase HflX [Stappia taiwanensis]|uniref:GTPase HflX n=1 Tax=Stappia taiwanensis TaxID=992267 RepID=A0A838XTW3_9HYPH|nr:GTPase HflX [Stappia taiwanensis]GGE79849.1 GTPase HflX [Stappia taiwanensis]
MKKQSRQTSGTPGGGGPDHASDGPRSSTGARAVVIVPVLDPRRRPDTGPEAPRRSPEARLEEAVGLAAAIELDVISSAIVSVSAPRPATLLGSGKVEDLGAIVRAEEVELVIVDHPLTPIQQRNLEKALECKVLDRTGLILEIFGARASTAEGTLQVELAHLKWQKSRLVRSWTHLERQRGGLGFIGGPGETQIEADRRLIQERITRLEKDLKQVSRTRELHRSKRRKVPQPVIALVGYTNAGKSTLFNRLTQSEVFAKDLLFATLDPTLRRIALPHGGEVILSDTVGFISDLPTHLVAAFRATLEEVTEADLILHVRDISHEDSEAQAADVADTLALLGLEGDQDATIIEVWNKIDLLAEDRKRAILAENARRPNGAIGLSAQTGEGVDALLARIEAELSSRSITYELRLPVDDGETLAWLYRNTEVMARQDSEDGVRISARVSERHRGGFLARCRGYLATPDPLPSADDDPSNEAPPKKSTGYDPASGSGTD